MTRVMAVTFEPRGQLHYLDPGEGSYVVGDWVLYPTDEGPEVAQVVWAPRGHGSEVSSTTSLPTCAGLADAAHLDQDAERRRMRARIEASARALIDDHGLAMKVVAVDFLEASAPHQGPGSTAVRQRPESRLAVIYYTAAERVDFRALVGELAAAVGARVDLRQIGARDAARVIGGIGTCGRELCCATFLTTIEPVGMRLAKDQHLPANPMQIAGACGRLKCCLAYEHPLYQDFAETAPPIGASIETSAGSGKVVAHHVPAQAVSVRTEAGETLQCPLSTVCASRPQSTVTTGDSR